MKKIALLVMAVSVPLGATNMANAADMSYAQKMQLMQQMQNSRPNAENYINSLQKVSVQPVTIPASERGHFYMPVKINGGEINMMADTGASSIFLSQADAQKLGINMGSLNYNVTYETANGKIQAAETIAKTIQVGDITMENVPITISQTHNNDMSLLGMEFFRRLSKYEVQNGNLVLYK